MQTTPYNSPGTLVYWCQNLREIPMGSPTMGVANRGGVGSDQWFLTYILLYLKTVQDKDMFTMEH